MGGGLSTSDSATTVGNQTMRGMADDNAAALQSLVNSTPLVPQFKISDSNQLLRDSAVVNALEGRRVGNLLNPELAGVEQEMQREAVENYNRAKAGDLPVADQRALAKAGLAGGLNTGAGMRPGSMGNLSASKLMASGNNALVDKYRALLGGVLQNNPNPIAALDPASTLGQWQNNQNVMSDNQNRYIQSVLGGTQNERSNRFNVGQSVMEAAAMQQNQNIADRAKRVRGTISAIGQGVGAGIGSMGGPMGSMMGGAAGKAGGEMFGNMM